jgi:hypothetical protein
MSPIALDGLVDPSIRCISFADVGYADRVHEPERAQ